MKTDSYLEVLSGVALDIELAKSPRLGLQQALAKIETIGLLNSRIRILGNDDYIAGQEGGLANDRLRKGIIDRVAMSGSPLIVPIAEGESAAEGGIAYLICVPVRAGHDIIAVLIADRENPPDDVLEKDLQMLTVLARLLIEPVRLLMPWSGSEGKIASRRNKMASLTKRVEEFERELIVDALRTTRGNQTKAAALLGVSLRIINYRMAKLNLDYRHFRKVN